VRPPAAIGQRNPVHRRASFNDHIGTAVLALVRLTLPRNVSVSHIIDVPIAAMFDIDPEGAASMFLMFEADRALEKREGPLPDPLQ